MTGSVVCKKVSFQHFILLTGLCWSQKENEAQDGMWKGVLERKWLALSGFSYILQTHTRADTNTHSEDTLYRSLAYFLLAEHHIAHSPHNLPEASLLANLPFDRNWPSSELPLPAACGHVSWSITRWPRQQNTHCAPREYLLVGEHAVSRWHVHMFVPFIYPQQRDSLSLHPRCDRERVTLPTVCVAVCVIHYILALYQHNWWSCQVGPWITFQWCEWPDWSIALCSYWPRYALYSGETLRRCGCHVTSGIIIAEKDGRVSQRHHVLYTQSVLTLARPIHWWQYLFVLTPLNVTKPTVPNSVLFCDVNFRLVRNFKALKL